MYYEIVHYITHIVAERVAELDCYEHNRHSDDSVP